MTHDKTQRAREIFLELSTLEPSAVQGEIDRLVGRDRDLRDAVVALLDARAAADADDFMASPTASMDPGRAAEAAGSQVGPYKLLQRIGEGGFGSVFLAEQHEPVRRRVALKIIKLGMDTKQVIARFEAERQALALMDHPHIARVFDAGATDSGRPYFAMEYVVGDAITKFADSYKLDIPARLALFAQICSAVQHAHTKGVIHRDLKPANVLVSMVDGKPFAKVIDFGIAKATASPLTEKTLFTEHRQLIGTPEYMSPEQADGSPDIDTRTDVYALGVLLYELLTGATPFDAKRLRSAAWGEMQRIIREEEPPAPSLRLSRDLASLASTAVARGVEPARLSTAVRGELDWVVMKALEKERARRYDTPAQFAEDVGRHLRGEPVAAAPPSRVYKAKKFVRRNKGAVSAGTAVAAALMFGFAGTAWGWREASRSNTLLRSNSEQIISNLSLMLGHVDPVEMNDGLPTVRIRDGLVGSIRYVPQIDSDGRRRLQPELIDQRRLQPELIDQRRVSVAESREYARFDAYNLGQLVGMAMKNTGALQKANQALRQQTDEAELARMRAEAQRDFAARSGRALLALLNREENNADLSYVRSVNASLDQSSDPSNSELIKSDVGIDLKALSAISLDTACKVIEANAILREQADRARDGVGAMLGILAYGKPGGPVDSFDPDTGVSEFETDPLGAAIAFGTDLAESLKEERDRLQDQYRRAEAGLGKMLGIATDGVPRPPLRQQVEIDGQLVPDPDPLGSAIDYGIQIAEQLIEQRDEAELSAYTAYLALGQQAMDAGDWPAARAYLAECPESKRGWEWSLIRGHAESVAQFYPGAFNLLSPSKSIVFSSTGRWARFYDAATGALLSEHDMGTVDWISGAVFSADESTCVVQVQNDIRTPLNEAISRSEMSVAVSVRPDGLDPSSPVSGRVYAVSPDGSSFVVDNSEWVGGIIGIFSRDGKIIQAIDSPKHAADFAVAYSPRGDYIAVLLKGRIRLYAPSGEVERDIAVDTRDRYRIVVSPDGQYLASATQSGLTVWNRDGDIVLTTTKEDRPYTGSRLWFTSDSTTVVSSDFGHDTIAWLLDGNEKARFTAPDTGTRWIDLANNGCLFAASTRRGVWVVDTTTGDMTFVDLPSGWDGYAVVSADSQSLVHFDRGNLTEMDIDGRVLSAGFVDPTLFLGITAVTKSRAFLNDVHSPSGRDGLASLEIPFRYTRQRVRWDADRSAVYAAAITGQAVGAAINREVTLPDGSRTIIADRRTLRFTDTASGHVVLTLPVELEVASLALSQEADRLVITFVDGSLEVLDIRPVEVQQAAIAAENERRALMRPVVQALLESETPTAELGSVLASHIDLSPAERHSAYELLVPRLLDIERDANEAFRDLTRRATSTDEGRSAVANADLPERVRTRAIELAQAWEFTPPAPTSDQSLIEETQKRRLDDASLALSE